MARGKEKDSDGIDGDQFIVMRISDLRRKAHEKGLDIDGSREALLPLSMKTPERIYSIKEYGVSDCNLLLI